MKELEIRLSGSGGQGILLSGRILAEALTMEQWQVAQSQSYEPTSRGGLSRSDLVASAGPVDYPLASSLDCLVVLHRIAAGAPVAALYRIPVGRSIVLPISETAKSSGSVRSTNMVALGALVTFADICRRDTLVSALEKVAPGKLVEPATEAFQQGVALAQAYLKAGGDLPQPEDRVALTAIDG